ncbi:MAG: hypothetical protein ACD_60C00130G0008 [uncultured bacterium]|nr:MAG: hypothetical protein ACD_60C00130G0008 [uncultured bacterium]
MTLYSLLFLMSISAVGLLILPFIAHNILFSRHFLVVTLGFIVCAIGIYSFSGNKKELDAWLSGGKKHYELQEEIAQLGGIDRIILKINQKLAANPQDATGWFILGKLYFAKQDYKNAKQALGKALKLQPNNVEIRHYYDNAAHLII